MRMLRRLDSKAMRTFIKCSSIKIAMMCFVLFSLLAKEARAENGVVQDIKKDEKPSNIDTSGFPAWVLPYAIEKGSKDIASFLPRVWGRKINFAENAARKRITLSFEVIDYESRKPLAEVLVVSEGKFAFTGKDGKSPDLLVELPEKTKQLVFNAIHPDYMPLDTFYGQKGKISIEKNTENKLIRIALVKSQALKVSGLVLSPEGSPLKDASLSVFYQEDPDDNERWTLAIDERDPAPEFEETIISEGNTYLVSSVDDFFLKLRQRKTFTSREDGLFSFEFYPVEGAERYKIIASYPNKGIAESIIPATNSKDIALRLKPDGGITISGLVFGEGGKGKAGVEIVDDFTGVKTTTDENGRFSFRHCHHGLYYFNINNLKSNTGERLPSIYYKSPYYGGQDPSDLRVPTLDEDISKAYQQGMAYAPPASERADFKFNASSCDRKGWDSLICGDFDKSIEEFSRSLLFGIARNIHDAYANRALGRIGKADLGGAMEDCANAIRINPLNARNYFIRGWIYVLGREWEKAASDFETAACISDNPYGAYGALFSGLIAQKQRREFPLSFEQYAQSLKGEWPSPLFEMIKGKISLEDCLANTGQDPERRTQAYFYFAMNEKEDASVSEKLKNALDADGKKALEYVFAALFDKTKINLTNAAPAAAKGEIENFLDFDSKGLFADWISKGHLNMELEDAPILPISGDLFPSGKALAVSTDGKSFIFLDQTKCPLLPDISDYESVSFWVFNKSDKTSNMEVQFIQEGGNTFYWRKVVIDQKGWQKITVPLRFMRWSDTGVPDWRRVAYLGFHFRDAANVLIDNVSFLRGTGLSSYVTTEEMAKIAMPNRKLGDIIIIDRPDMRIISDAKQINEKELISYLNLFVSEFKKDFSFIQEPSFAPTLLIFESMKDYGDFAPRFAAMLNSTSIAPSSGGYTFMGIAQSYWNPKYGTKRPVYGHEFLHAYLEMAASLQSSSGDWTQEGIANYYQMKINPQNDLGTIIRSGILDKDQHSELKELLSGKKVSGDRYWQALSVVDMLINMPKYSKHLNKLFDAMQKTGSTDMNKHLGLLECDWDEFEKDWKDYNLGKYK